MSSLFFVVSFVMARRSTAAVFAVVVASVAGNRGAALAVGQPDEAVVARLIRELDAEEFAVRRRAQEELRKLGQAAAPALKRALKDASPEVTRTATCILRELREVPIRAGFKRLAEQAEADESKVDLEEGMLLIAELVEGEIDRAAVKKQLDDYAAAVRAKLGDVEPAKADPQRVVAALREVLFTTAGFDGAARAEGATEVYADPRHSSLPHVLKTKRGLPITLSHVVICVGDRLGVPLVGLGLPGRYMLKYEGNRAPEGFPKDDIIIDAFEAGRIASKDDLYKLLGARDIEDQLRPSPRRASLARMLTNVVSHLRAAHSDQTALGVEVLRLIEPASGKELPPLIEPPTIDPPFDPADEAIP